MFYDNSGVFILSIIAGETLKEKGRDELFLQVCVRLIIKQFIALRLPG